MIFVRNIWFSMWNRIRCILVVGYILNVGIYIFVKIKTDLSIYLSVYLWTWGYQFRTSIFSRSPGRQSHFDLSQGLHCVITLFHPLSSLPVFWSAYFHFSLAAFFFTSLTVVIILTHLFHFLSPCDTCINCLSIVLCTLPILLTHFNFVNVQTCVQYVKSVSMALVIHSGL